MKHYTFINQPETIDIINNKTNDLSGFILKKDNVILYSSDELDDDNLLNELTASAGIAGYASMPRYKEDSGNIYLLRSRWPVTNELPKEIKRKMMAVDINGSLVESIAVNLKRNSLTEILHKLTKEALAFQPLTKQLTKINKDLSPLTKIFIKPNKSEDALNSVDPASETKEEIKNKETLLKLIQESNPDLLLRVIKDIDPEFDPKNLKKLITNPNLFFEKTLAVAKKNGVSKSELQSRYNKLKKAFFDHFNETLSIAAKWQLDLFAFEVKIVAVYLAYSSIIKKISVSKVISDLVKDLDPTDLRFTQQKEFTDSALLKQLATIGFIGVLIFLALKFKK